MKVLFWMNNGFETYSTSEHLLSAVIERLVLEGNRVHVIQMNQGCPMPILPKKLAGLGVTTDGISIKKTNKSNFVARYLEAIKSYCKCKRLIKIHNDADVTFLQSTNVAGIAVWLVRKNLKKTIITYNVQDIFPYNLAYCGRLKMNGLVFKCLAAFQRYGYKHSDNIITISEDMKETLVSDGVPASKVNVVYNWSYQDDTYEELDLTPVSHMFDRNYFNVVYAGNIGVMQNVDILIEAAKLIKEDKSIWFHIIGNGVYKDKLEARAKEFGITNISFWPMQPPEMAPLIYSAADVNVIPLVKDVYRTALPSKTATCLACQKPIIFAIGKNSKFGKEVQKETGCIVTESDRPEELAIAIRSVKNNKIKIDTAAFFKKKCSITNNSERYAKIIAGR